MLRREEPPHHRCRSARRRRHPGRPAPRAHPMHGFPYRLGTSLAFAFSAHRWCHGTNSTLDTLAVLPVFWTLMRIRHARGCCWAASAVDVVTATETSASAVSPLTDSRADSVTVPCDLDCDC